MSIDWIFIDIIFQVIWIWEIRFMQRSLPMLRISCPIGLWSMEPGLTERHHTEVNGLWLNWIQRHDINWSTVHSSSMVLRRPRSYKLYAVFCWFFNFVYGLRILGAFLFWDKTFVVQWDVVLEDVCDFFFFFGVLEMSFFTPKRDYIPWKSLDLPESHRDLASQEMP